MNRSALIVVAFAVAFASVGCRHSRSSITGPGMNSKREASLLITAAARLNCPADQLTPTFVQSLEKNLHLYQVVGCGSSYGSLLHCIGVCNWREMPDGRAATELGCPAEKVTRSYAGNGNFTYAGCEKSVTYLHKGLSEWVTAPSSPSTSTP